MITLEIKTSLSEEDEQIFLKKLLDSIDQAEFQTRFENKKLTEPRFVRSVGVGVGVK